MPPKRAQPENFPHSENVKVTVNEDPPTLEEKEHVLKTFKNNKSAGTDQRKTEGLKYNSSNQLIRVLFFLFITKFGGQESPCIFTYYFDYVLKVAACETDKQFPDGWSIEFDFNIPHF